MSNTTLLIIDDEPDIRQLLRIFFERQGYTVLLAPDGQLGIELARQHLPDLILMDIQMPQMNGIEAVRLLRADPRFAATPIIALTAYARVHVAADILRAGFDEAVYKPIDFVNLQELIEGTVRKG